VLGVALVGAAGAAVVVVRGRDTARATRGWLDSATAPGASDVGAAAAATTRENTTAVPVRRSGGPVRAPAPVFEPDTGLSGDAPGAEVDDDDAPPALEPTPPLVPPRAGRPARPTVPRPDTAFVPDSLDRR
jgi:hypothetical protein